MVAAEKSVREIREFAAVSHFIHLFKAPLKVGRMNADRLEEVFTQPATQRELADRLHVPLLRRVVGRASDITAANWALKCFRRYEEEICAWQGGGSSNGRQVAAVANQRDTEAAFEAYCGLEVETRVLLVHGICEELADVAVVRDHMKAHAGECQPQPLAVDEAGSMYWCFDNRLYREEPATFSGKAKSRRLVREGAWRTLCVTLDEWRAVVAGMEESRSGDQKRIAKKIEESVLKKVESALQARRREERRKLAVVLPRKRSSRIVRLEEAKRVKVGDDDSRGVEVRATKQVQPAFPRLSRYPARNGRASSNENQENPVAEQ